MIQDHLSLMNHLKEYSSPKSKLTRMIQTGEWIHLRRGLYRSADDKSSPHVLAPMIYGPSYLSFEFALSFHQLIPERAYVFTSAIYARNKQKTFHTPIGDYYYWNIPPLAYPHGILLQREGEIPFLIASPEKAICDTLYKLHKKRNGINLSSLLLEDWRMEWESLQKLDIQLIQKIAPLYRKRILLTFVEWMQKEILHV
jgi:hypothetical protein